MQLHSPLRARGQSETSAQSGYQGKAGDQARSNLNRGEVTQGMTLPRISAVFVSPLCVCPCTHVCERVMMQMFQIILIVRKPAIYWANAAHQTLF